jgi:CheY-like chemotaxis protein
VTSEPGKGSLFWFEVAFPFIERTPRKTTSPDRTIIGYEGPRRRILIVDDSKYNRRVLTRLLLPLGFLCAEAENGQDGLKQAQEEPPDLILLDLIMPEMSGFEAVREFRKDPGLVNTVIIAVSASAFEREIEQSKQAGCHAFLPKPIATPALFAALETYLALKWIYEEAEGELWGISSESSSFKLPSLHELDVLYKSALKGDLIGIQQQAAVLKQTSPEFTLFADKIIQLAKNYSDMGLLNFIEAAMKEQEEQKIRRAEDKKSRR